MMLRAKWLGLGCFALCLGVSGVVRAADFYVDPAAGDMQNDGSEQHPWSTLQAVLEADLIETQQWEQLPYEDGAALVPKNAGAPVKAGDTIWLRTGYHGDILIQDAYNASDITIAAESGQAPRIRRLHVQAASHWVVRGLSISLEHAPTYDRETMVTLESHGFRGPAHDIVVESCDIVSVDDVSGWTLTDWNDLPANAVSVSGDDCTIRGNQIRNVNFGISVTGERALVERNTVDSFAGDGMRGIGNYGTYQYNTIKNCYDVNDNHDDGFQSWSLGPDGDPGDGEVVGITLRGNTFINYEDPNQPFRGPLQGIGCFDGMYVDFVIENNVIITDTWHGITLAGARNSRIVNNTVLDVNEEDPGPPWIRISSHKNCTTSESCVVRNNLTTNINIEDGQDVEEDNNIIIDDASLHFVDPANLDLHLLASSPAVDTGSATLAPSADRDEIPRPQGSGIDIGAYEYFDGDPVYPDAGPDGGVPEGGAGSGGSGGVGGAGSGGSSGVGGADGSAAGGEGGSSGSGGASGGAGTGGGGTGGGALGSTPSSDDDGGCGCVAVGSRSPGAAEWGLLAVALGLLVGGRRRQR